MKKLFAVLCALTMLCNVCFVTAEQETQTACVCERVNTMPEVKNINGYNKEDNTPGVFQFVDAEAREDIAALYEEIAGLKEGESKEKDILGLMNWEQGSWMVIQKYAEGYTNTSPNRIRTTFTTSEYQQITFNMANPDNWYIYAVFDSNNNLISSNNAEWTKDTVTVNGDIATVRVCVACGANRDIAVTPGQIAETGMEIVAVMAEDEGLPVRMKVASYNVGLYTAGENRDWTSDDDAGIPVMRKLLCKENADIIGLQEIRPQVGESTEDAEIYNYLYPYSHCLSTLGSKGIKSRYKLLNCSSGTLSASGRTYVKSTVKINKKMVTVLCVHLSPYADQRPTDHTEILSILATCDSFICFGDFNAGNNGSTADWTEYEAYKAAGYHLANGGYVEPFSTKEVKYLDNIITSADIVIANSYTIVPEGNPSDHQPVFAELVIC